MSGFRRNLLSAVVFGVVCLRAETQEKNIPAGKAGEEAAKARLSLPPALESPAAGVAVTVNGMPILEGAIKRALKPVPKEHQEDARNEVLERFIDDALIDQHLLKLPITVEVKDVDEKAKHVQDMLAKQYSTLEKGLKELILTEAEIRATVTAQLRWEKFTSQQSSEKALRSLFDGNRNMFDGTVVRARHIFLTTPMDDAKANEAAKSKLLALRKQIENDIAQGLAKQPKPKDNSEAEKLRAKLLEDFFAAAAAKESACPSKSDGGDLGWFPRGGSEVDGFAKAAFSLKAHQMSDVISTPFGHHLILTTDRKPGKEVTFEEVKDDVIEVFCDRLKENLIAQLRLSAKIVVHPRPKPTNR